MLIINLLTLYLNKQADENVKLMFESIQFGSTDFELRFNAT